MGLTIHYDLQTKLTRVGDVRRLVGALRQYAMDLPFQKVEEVVEFEGKDVSYENQHDPHRWLKIQVCRYPEEPQHGYAVAPLHIIGFTTIPGEGSEPANIGFCHYPKTMVLPSDGRRVRTNFRGWLWGSRCKTQYASDPECGGVPNFLRSHLCLVKLLDFAKKTNLIDVKVTDEGGYWQIETLKKLAKQVGEWNEMMAAMVGQLKDAAQTVGMVTESPITGFVNFEHLEVKGLERFKKLGLQGDV